MRENDLTSNTAYRYTHDLWNRLVKVEHVTDPGGSETVVTRGEYEYYGTHWRSVKKADSDLSGGVDELRQQYYTAGWQLIEERIDDAWTSGFTRDRTMQNLFGARYIDDILMHREDHDGDGDFTDIGSERWWHLTDVQFSTVAIIDDAAVVAERIQYDAYGRAYHHQSNDTDGDGDYDSTDHNAISTASGTNIDDVGYEPDLDVDRDGSITDTDSGLAGTTYSSALSRGELSNATVKNTIGWDGYVFNPEHEMYHVRFRWYSPELGRWLERDLLGLAAGMDLYEYSLSSPRLFSDPTGLHPGLLRRALELQHLYACCKTRGLLGTLVYVSTKEFSGFCERAQIRRPGAWRLSGEWEILVGQSFTIPVGKGLETILEVLGAIDIEPTIGVWHESEWYLQNMAGRDRWNTLGPIYRGAWDPNNRYANGRQFTACRCKHKRTVDVVSRCCGYFSWDLSKGIRKDVVEVSEPVLEVDYTLGVVLVKRDAKTGRFWWTCHCPPPNAAAGWRPMTVKEANERRNPEIGGGE